MFGDLDKNTKQFPNRKLNEISAYWNGLTYKPADAVEAGSGTLVLRSSNIQDGSLAFDDNVYVGCTIKEKLFVQDNDILMCSRNGSAALVGKTALIKGLTEPTTFGAFMMIIRSDYYSYLKTYFETPFFRNKISTGTSTINQITGKMLNEISLPVPDMDTVRRFEEFTHQSDKSKFVRFKSQFIEMFGDPTENPNGWTKLNVKEAVKQGYIARPLDGNHGEKHPKGDDYVPEGVPFLMAQDLKDKRVDFTSCHFITEEQASTLKKGWAKEGDVLLTHKGTIGRVAIVQPSQYENMLLTPQITYYRCLKDIDNEYLAAYFMTGFFVEQLERLRTGTTRACVTITQQEQLELIIPPVPMQREFVKFVNQSDKSK